MSRGHGTRLAAVVTWALVSCGCASHSKIPEPGGCPLDDLPLASFIEEVNRCTSGPIALANSAAGDRRLGGALCVCQSDHLAFALRWLGIETIEAAPIPLAQAGRREQRAVQQESAK